MPDRFGPALRAARKGAGKTIDQLAKELGFSKTYLSDVERSLRPPLAVVKILVAASRCGVRPETLIAPAARDKGYLEIPVTSSMSDDVLMVLVKARVAFREPRRVTLSTLQGLFRS